MFPGIDRASVRDVRDSIERFGDRYLTRVFTPAERDQADALTEPARSVFLTGRFAAKEAVHKALRVPGDWSMPWSDIEIGPQAPPLVRLRGRAYAWAARSGIDTVEISIAETENYAVAGAVATTGRPHDSQSTNRRPIDRQPTSRQTTNTEDK